jgi:hypothetical protein
MVSQKLIKPTNTEGIRLYVLCDIPNIRSVMYHIPLLVFCELCHIFNSWNVFHVRCTIPIGNHIGIYHIKSKNRWLSSYHMLSIVVHL